MYKRPPNRNPKPYPIQPQMPQPHPSRFLRSAKPPPLPAASPCPSPPMDHGAVSYSALTLASFASHLRSPRCHSPHPQLASTPHLLHALLGCITWIEQVALHPLQRIDFVSFFPGGSSSASSATGFPHWRRHGLRDPTCWALDLASTCLYFWFVHWWRPNWFGFRLRGLSRWGPRGQGAGAVAVDLWRRLSSLEARGALDRRRSDPRVAGRGAACG
jgi:hypothetical protein